MGYFAGLDVSLEETAICVVDDAGRIVREARAPSEPEALVAFFGAFGMAMERVGLEACSLTAWLHEGLTRSGLAGDLHRDAPGQGGDGRDAEQDRPQRRARRSRRSCAPAGIGRCTSRARPAAPGARC